MTRLEVSALYSRTTLTHNREDDKRGLAPMLLLRVKDVKAR